MNRVQLIKANDEINVKASALFGFIFPAGISLPLVRGFIASNFLSTKRLNAMAAVLANTIQKSINKNFSSNISDDNPEPFTLFVFIKTRKPRKKPIKAKGNAKIV